MQHPHTKKQRGDDEGIFPHEGNCFTSLCETCGCCMHCPADCGCEGCADEWCVCTGKMK